MSIKTFNLQKVTKIVNIKDRIAKLPKGRPFWRLVEDHEFSDGIDNSSWQECPLPSNDQLLAMYIRIGGPAHERFVCKRDICEAYRYLVDCGDAPWHLDGTVTRVHFGYTKPGHRSDAGLITPEYYKRRGELLKRLGN